MHRPRLRPPAPRAVRRRPAGREGHPRPQRHPEPRRPARPRRPAPAPKRHPSTPAPSAAGQRRRGRCRRTRTSILTISSVSSAGRPALCRCRARTPRPPGWRGSRAARPRRAWSRSTVGLWGVGHDRLRTRRRRRQPACSRPVTLREKDPATAASRYDFVVELIDPRGKFDGADVQVKTSPDFATDLASVPRFLTWLIPRYGQYTRAAIIHDYLCQQNPGPVDPGAATPLRTDPSTCATAPTPTRCSGSCSTSWRCRGPGGG